MTKWWFKFPQKSEGSKWILIHMFFFAEKKHEKTIKKKHIFAPDLPAQGPATWFRHHLAAQLAGQSSIQGRLTFRIAGAAAVDL
jgi:hypothetical protein